MSPLRLILLLGVAVSCAHGEMSVLDYLTANISTEWNEDLGPVLKSFSKVLSESFPKTLLKELTPVAQEFLHDKQISPECLQSMGALAAGIGEGQLWAMRCE